MTRPDVTLGAGHRFPYQLPDGSGTLFGALDPDNNAELVLLPAGSEDWITMASADQRFSGLRYLPTGHLVYGQGGSILAVGFDLARKKLVGTPVPLIDAVQSSPVSQYVWFSVSDTGTLVYFPTSTSLNPSQLIAIRSNGVATNIAPLEGAGLMVRLSPDGKRALIVVRSSGTADAWTYDVDRGVGIKATSGLDVRYAAAWMPNGQDLTVAAHGDLYTVDASGTGTPKLLLGRGNNGVLPLSWSADGQHLLFQESHSKTGADILLFSVNEGPGEKVTPLLAGAADESQAVFSPDARWIAYTSNETGSSEIYVRSFPQLGNKERVSRSGGRSARWFQDGTRLFLYYWNGTRVLRVPLSTDPLRFGAGEPIDSGSGFADVPTLVGGYDIAPDGSILAVRTPTRSTGTTDLRVVLNWEGELRQRVPLP